MLKYLKYDTYIIDEEVAMMDDVNYAELVLEPSNKKCLFLLGMLFAKGVKIKLLNEKDLDLAETNKSFSMMPYVWSKISDDSFVPDESREMDKRIENAKRNGVKVEKINNNEIDNKIFLICPVRNATKEQKEWIEEYTKEKQEEGYIFHAPHLHTNQHDLLGGYNICRDNAMAIASSKEVDIYYSQSSTGSVFDLGVAYALEKPLVLLNESEIEFDTQDMMDMVVKTWPFNKKVMAKVLTKKQK